MSKRGEYPVTLPDVMIAYKLGDLNNHPYYPAAKAGDFEAAFRIARDMITSNIADKILNRFGRDATLLPVLAQEAQGRNKIPLALALQIEDLTGIPVEMGVGQITKVSRTSMSGLDRVFVVPEFAGMVRQGTSYLLLDDTLTQGGTFAALASHIMQQGGTVHGAFALTGKQYSARLILEPATLNELRKQHGDIENEFQTVTGYSYSALTQSEARTLASFRPPEQVRIRIADERDARSGTPDTQEIQNSLIRLT